jgi:HAMP domain-containing protein
MSLQIRTILLTVSLLILAVVSTTAVLAVNARGAILDTIQDDGIGITRRIAISANAFDQISHDTEATLGQHMSAEATLVSYFVAAAEAAGERPVEINAQLEAITAATTIDEIRVTDGAGRVYLGTGTIDGLQFAADSPSWPLLSGGQREVIEAAGPRASDGQEYKYVAVAGVDRPRIVQVGVGPEIREQREQNGLAYFYDQLVSRGKLNAIHLLDTNLQQLNLSTRNPSTAERPLDSREASTLRTVMDQRDADSYLDGDALKVMAPVIGANGDVIGAVFVEFPTDQVSSTISTQLQLAAIVAALVLAAGVAASVFLARRVTRPVAQLTAAAQAVEEGAFEPEMLARVIARRGELGRLGLVFQRMAEEVRARERRLLREVEDLRIEIDVGKKVREVAEITDSEYFHQLEERALRLRARAARTDVQQA